MDLEWYLEVGFKEVTSTSTTTLSPDCSVFQHTQAPLISFIQGHFSPIFFNNSLMIPLNWSGALPNIFQLGVHIPVRHCQINSGSSTNTRKIQKPGEQWPNYFGLSKEKDEHKRPLLVPWLQTLTEIRCRRKDVLVPFIIGHQNFQM